MDEHKKCKLCGAPATVHITQVINDKSMRIDLCEKCAQKEGYIASSGLPFSMLASLGESLFNGIKSTSMKIGQAVCETCGCSPEVFKKNGRLGCKDCYKHLATMIDSIISNTQKGNKHIGKQLSQVHSCHTINTSKSDEVSKKTTGNTNDSIESLQGKLIKAIEDERYEDAAKIRDQIKSMRK